MIESKLLQMARAGDYDAACVVREAVLQHCMAGVYDPLFTLPEDWRARRILVPGWARAFRVPSRIVRIDIDEAGRAGTHGWQVRNPGMRYLLISDAKFDTERRRGTPAESLRAATSLLAALIPTGRLEPRTREPQSA